MPQAIGMALAYTAAGAAAVSAVTPVAVALGTTGAALLGSGVIMVAAAGYGAYQKRRQVKAYNASLEDRTQTVRSSEEPRTFVYGRTRVNGLLTYAVTHGSNREKVSMILTMGGHPFDSFVGFWSDDNYIGATVAPNYWAPAGSVLSRSVTDYKTYETPTNSTGPGYQIDLSGQLNGGTLAGVDGVAYRFYYQVGTGDGDTTTQSASVTLVPPVPAWDPRTPQWSLSGSTITLLAGTEQSSGYPLVVTYRVSFVDKNVAKLRWYLGSESDPNLLDSDLINATLNERGPWTSAHLGRKVPRVHCEFTWDETVFSSGLPNISAVVKGKKVYDSRPGAGQSVDTSSTWTWSDNPALCAADYLREACGATSSEIDWDSVTAAANICDEWVQCQATLTVTAITKANPAKVTTSVSHKLLAGQAVRIDTTGMTQIDYDTPVTGGYRTVTAVVSDTEFTVDADSTGYSTFTSGTCYRVQKRFTCNGVLSMEADMKSNLEAILSSMGGMVLYSGGKFYVNAAAYKAPSLTLDDSDLADGTITLQARAARADLFNSVRGTFRNPEKLYAVDEFPPYESSYHITTEDNNEKIFEDFEFPMTDDSVAAQRLAKLALWRSRLSITLEATWKIYAYAVQPGDTVRLKLTRYGWETVDSNQGKEFRVIDREFIDLSTVRLLLQEEDVDIYNWTYGDAIVNQLPPKTNLPRGNQVAPPTNVSLESNANTYYTRPDGSIVPYVEVKWTAPVTTDAFVRVRWKRMIDLEFWQIDCPVGAEMARLEGLGPNETIKVYLVAINGIWAQSARVDLNPYTTSGALPTPTSPLSANLLKNTTFASGVTTGWSTAAWPAPLGTAPALGTPDSSVIGVPGDYYNIRGNIRNVAFVTDSQFSGSNLSGNGYAMMMLSDPVLVPAPGAKVAYFAEVSTSGTNCRVDLVCYSDAGTGYITQISGNVVARAVNTIPLPYWGDISVYTRSGGLATIPAGTKYVRLGVYGLDNWDAGIRYKAISVFKPFLGFVNNDVTTYPPWASGMQEPTDTGLTPPEAMTGVIKRNPGVSYSLPFNPTGPLTEGNGSWTLFDEALPARGTLLIKVHGTVAVTSAFYTPSNNVSTLNASLNLRMSGDVPFELGVNPVRKQWAAPTAAGIQESDRWELSETIEVDEITDGVQTPRLKLELFGFAYGPLQLPTVSNVEVRIEIIKR